MIYIKQLLIDGVDYSEYATIPLQDQKTLDESLDVSYIEVKGVEIEQPFTPFANVYLKLTDNLNNIKDFYMLIESDEITEVISIKRYNHNVLFIEETKWLERFFIEKSRTKPLIHDYLAGATKVYPEKVSGTFTTKPIEAIISPLANGTVYTFPSVQEVYENSSDSGGFTVIENSVEIYSIDDINATYTMQLNNNSTYEVIYSSTQYDPVGPSGSFINSKNKYTFLTIPQNKELQPRTLRDTINVILRTFETLRESEQPRFLLADINDYNQSEEYKIQVQKILDTESPDFYFAKMSVFEALKTIGDYAHFIPRMRNKKIYLDLLGRDEVAEMLDDYYSSTASQNTNDFCTKLDSQVNNFVNLDNEQQGSVVTPFNDGWKTLRAQEGEVVITEGNIIIPTESPIEKIIKLEIGYLDDGTYVGDITPYVYEKAEYEALSSYTDQYPYSKMFAITYTQGSPNITGLSFERQNVVSQAFESIAIKNIIFRKTNKDVNWWNSLTDTQNTLNLQYRLTYIPLTSARITQSKAYTENIKKSVSIAYNQSASKISSNAYGENLKGQILKIGNVEKTKMFMLPTLDLIPECGKKYDEDYYIATVKCEYYPNFIKCELGLSKDFNNKSAYIEVDSELRFYEISEKMAYDVYRVYEDYCEIGELTQSDNKSLITKAGINEFIRAFEKNYAGTNITMVRAKGIDRFGDARQFTLPVISLGVGNSILLEYHYADNFSAGASAKYDGSNKVQQLEQYTDIYGEFETLELKYGENIEKPTLLKDAIEMGDNLPNYENEMRVYLSTEGDNLQIYKDSREVLHISYQMHFVANDKNIIIGSGLSQYSSFVTSEVHNFEMYILNKKLNKFENEIDLTNATLCDSILTSRDYENSCFKIEDITAKENGKAWVIVQNLNGKAILVLGKNIDIKKDEQIIMPYFVFKRKLEGDK